jgi:hypothetical protein
MAAFGAAMSAAVAHRPATIRAPIALIRAENRPDHRHHDFSFYCIKTGFLTNYSSSV